MNPHIVVVGSLNADFVIRVDRFPVAGETLTGRKFNVFPGGKGANQAYAAGKLGARVSMVGQVGNDAHADWLRANLVSAQVDVTHVYSDPAVSSGIATITINRDGQNQIIIVPGANGTFGIDALNPSLPLLGTAGLVLLQLEIPMETVLAAAQHAQRAGALVILDPAPARALPEELLGLTDYLTPNETELAILCGQAPQTLSREQAASLACQLQARGAKKVIVKMGAQGALLLGKNSNHFWPALKVTAVDTTAAGDAFNAAFASALARGCSDLDAGIYATAAAAWSVGRAGAQPSMPTAAEVEQFLGLP